METTHAVPVTGASPTHAPSLSVWERTAAIFARPAHAWGGLETRAQWWFPLLVMMVVGAVITAALHDRAIVPMVVDQWETQIDAGKMTAAQMEQMESFMRSPAGVVVTTVQQVIVWPIIMLLLALLLWFGIGFVLGTRVRYRHAFEVVCWSSLALIPSQILTTVLAWSRETLQGVHVGFGILLPESDSPGKLQGALGILLDGLGPLSLWPVVVAILGAAALSGAPRKSVAWVVGGLYIAVLVFAAALAAMFTPMA
ncbi:MAG TPA: YIP1 family protein [Candidatus Limnocylindria bacterium]|nr:YIP1 family protein [Candidatus Limnocylindria bacterium]